MLRLAMPSLYLFVFLVSSTIILFQSDVLAAVVTHTAAALPVITLLQPAADSVIPIEASTQLAKVPVSFSIKNNAGNNGNNEAFDDPEAYRFCLELFTAALHEVLPEVCVRIEDNVLHLNGVVGGMHYIMKYFLKERSELGSLVEMPSSTNFRYFSVAATAVSGSTLNKQGVEKEHSLLLKDSGDIGTSGSSSRSRETDVVEDKLRLPVINVPYSYTRLHTEAGTGSASRSAKHHSLDFVASYTPSSSSYSEHQQVALSIDTSSHHKDKVRTLHKMYMGTVNIPFTLTGDSSSGGSGGSGTSKHGQQVDDFKVCLRLFERSDDDTASTIPPVYEHQTSSSSSGSHHSSFISPHLRGGAETAVDASSTYTSPPVHITDGAMVLDWTCAETEYHTEFIIKHLAEGKYTALLALHSNNHRDSSTTNHSEIVVGATLTDHPASHRFVDLELHRSIELVPSYDWQPLRVWHSIPSGLEMRLPMGGIPTGTSTSSTSTSTSSGGKEARIPDPWRLQLPMPAPCKFFLRMDVYKGTTIAEISAKASQQCKLPSTDCILIKGKSQVEGIGNVKEGSHFLHPSATVLSSDFFNTARKELVYNEMCRHLV